MKKCSKCKILKSLDEFHNHKRAKDGKKSACKSCNKTEWARYRATYPDRIKASNKKYYLKNKDKIAAQNKQWSIDNQDKMVEYKKKHYQDNISIYRERRKAWKKANPGKINAQTAKRRANKLKATPHWLTKDDLKWINWYYMQAKRLTALTGVEHHVDHIHPLNGNDVCGLHVPWNLQILTAEENLSKGNRIKLV